MKFKDLEMKIGNVFGNEKEEDAAKTTKYYDGDLW